ncbi:MAG TPA: hypothetical protein EYN51_03410 [Flavobacteriales bacterium]|nr:hypothetical protein [Flavobacteriales bacterium]
MQPASALHTGTYPDLTFFTEMTIEDELGHQFVYDITIVVEGEVVDPNQTYDSYWQFSGGTVNIVGSFLFEYYEDDYVDVFAYVATDASWDLSTGMFTYSGDCYCEGNLDLSSIDISLSGGEVVDYHGEVYLWVPTEVKISALFGDDVHLPLNTTSIPVPSGLILFVSGLLFAIPRRHLG